VFFDITWNSQRFDHRAFEAAGWPTTDGRSVIVESMGRLGIRHIDIHDHAAEGLAHASEARSDR